MVVRPLPATREFLWQLWAKSELVDLVAHRMFLWSWDVRRVVVLQIVRVHVARGETAPRRDVEVPDYLVHPDDALQSASLASLRIDPLAVVLPLALLDVLAPAKGPLFRCVCLAHFVACVAAAGFRGLLWWGCAAAFAAVAGVEMRG